MDESEGFMEGKENSLGGIYINAILIGLFYTSSGYKKRGTVLMALANGVFGAKFPRVNGRGREPTND